MFCAVPQHMPLALLATMPPILQALIEAGSGPILRPKGASQALAWAPITPGCRRICWPWWRISRPFQLSPSTISTESLMAWPDRLVPAARKVTGTRSRWASLSRATTSSSDSTRTTSLGISR
ncbi:hypothetical protein D9M71_779140 [compost metagenome]